MILWGKNYIYIFRFLSSKTNSPHVSPLKSVSPQKSASPVVTTLTVNLGNSKKQKPSVQQTMKQSPQQTRSPVKMRTRESQIF